MTLKLNLGSYLERHNITAYRLVKEVEGRVAPNTVYSLARRPAQRIDLTTVGVLMKALEQLTGKKVEFSEMLEEEQMPDLSHLRLPPRTPAYDPGKARKFHYSGMGTPVKIEGAPSINDIVSEGRDRG